MTRAEHPLATATRSAAFARAPGLRLVQVWRLARALDRLQAIPPAMRDRLLRGEDGAS